uniref:Putative secreted protein n=1 Tax=Panstrongylus lignarius TaxID=156445 RepID=A0A224Y5I5_9HEMI
MSKTFFLLLQSIHSIFSLYSEMQLKLYFCIIFPILQQEKLTFFASLGYLMIDAPYDRPFQSYSFQEALEVLTGCLPP